MLHGKSQFVLFMGFEKKAGNAVYYIALIQCSYVVGNFWISKIKGYVQTGKCVVFWEHFYTFGMLYCIKGPYCIAAVFETI